MWLTSLVVTSLLASVTADITHKIWVRSWDLDARNNWEDKKLPCVGKTASLPNRPSHPLFLGAKVTVGTLELPEEGQVIFGDGANLVLDDKVQGECQQNRKWDHQGQDSWWDPKVWHYPQYEDPSTSPVPHIHRVPCTRDTVQFTNPNRSLYSVHLSPPAISVSKLKIGDKEYSTSELAAYARSSEGNFRFQGVSSNEDNAPLYVETPKECSDITGCLCGTETAATKICSIMKQNCPTTKCENPIKMTGFCCEVCGAEVTVAHNGSLPLDDVRRLLKEHLLTPVAKDIRAYSSKMNDNQFHIYFTAASENGNYKAASVAFRTKFEQELSAGGQHTTLLAYSGSIDITSRKGPSANSIAASFITLAVCLAIGLAVYYLKKRRITSDLSFMFRRLESSSRRVSVVSDVGGRRLSTTSSMFVPSYSREGGLRFLNPIFNQSMASLVGGELRERPEGSVTSSEGQIEGQHENPMYTAYENMSPEERQASEDTLRAQEQIIQDDGDISIDETKQEIIQHTHVKSELDVIAEEKPSSTESDEQGCKEVKDDEVLGVDNPSLDLTEENPEKETVTEQSEPKTIPYSQADHPFPSSGFEKEEGFLDIFDGDNITVSATTDAEPELTVQPSTSNENHQDTSEGVTVADRSSRTSSSSSNDSINIHMDIEGFVPLKDIGFGK